MSLSLFLYFSSLLINSDRFMEFRENETYMQIGAGVTGEDLVINLTNRLEAGNHETRLGAADKLGKLGELAANNLVEKKSS